MIMIIKQTCGIPTHNCETNFVLTKFTSSHVGLHVFPVGQRHLLNYCRSGNIREVLIFAKFAWGTNSSTKKNENLRILNFVKSREIRNSRKFKHAKITRSTVCLLFMTCNLKTVRMLLLRVQRMLRLEVRTDHVPI